MSPVTGEPAAEVAAAGAEDVDRTVRAAHEAFERHRWRTAFERAAELERVADVIEARTRGDGRADLVVEHGKPLAEALGEIGSAASGLPAGGRRGAPADRRDDPGRGSRTSG